MTLEAEKVLLFKNYYEEIDWWKIFKKNTHQLQYIPDVSC